MNNLLDGPAILWQESGGDRSWRVALNVRLLKLGFERKLLAMALERSPAELTRWLGKEAWTIDEFDPASVVRPPDIANLRLLVDTMNMLLSYPDVETLKERLEKKWDVQRFQHRARLERKGKKKRRR